MSKQTTFSGVPGDSRCECSDVNCPMDHGALCGQVATQILYRIDMDDVSGTAFCDKCADDAFESGLFTDSVDDDDTETHTDADGYDEQGAIPRGK